MNFAAGLALFRHHPELFIFQNPGHLFIALWPVNRGQQTSFHQGQASASFIVVFVHTVADHTGNAFP